MNCCPKYLAFSSVSWHKRNPKGAVACEERPFAYRQPKPAFAPLSAPADKRAPLCSGYISLISFLVYKANHGYQYTLLPSPSGFGWKSLPHKARLIVSNFIRATIWDGIFTLSPPLVKTVVVSLFTLSTLIASCFNATQASSYVRIVL